MDVFQSVVVLALCGLSCASGTGERWRGGAEGTYARYYPSGEQRQPHRISPSSRITFAAIPLHAPVPILQVFVPRLPPLRSRQPVPASVAYEEDLEPYASAYTEAYSPYASGLKPSDEGEEPPVVIYARPNKNGGFSYRQRPATATPRPKREPIVFRIHKYKITKE